jgi:hypothetical protein
MRTRTNKKEFNQYIISKCNHKLLTVIVIKIIIKFILEWLPTSLTYCRQPLNYKEKLKVTSVYPELYKGNIFSRETVLILKTSRNRHMLLAALVQLIEKVDLALECSKDAKSLINLLCKRIIIIHFISIQFNSCLFTRKLSSTEAN